MSKVTQEIAEQEVSGWLDSRKISENERVEKTDQIKVLVNAVMEGYLIVNEDGTLTQILKFAPISDNAPSAMAIVPIKELKYKSRLSLAQLQAATKGSNANDGYGVIIAIVALLTSQLKQSIGALDTGDSGVASSIAGFFLM
jgi:hypothetical protein